MGSPVPVPIKQHMLACTSKAKLAHTHTMMGLTEDQISALDAKLATYVKRIHCLPPTMATAAVHSPQSELGLGFPSVREDYASAASQMWLLLNEGGALGEAARHSFDRSWPQISTLARLPSFILLPVPNG